MAGTRQRTSTTTWRVSSVRSPSSFSPSSSSSTPSPSGDYGEELEKRKFNDKDETDYYDSLEFCADLVWNGEFVLNIATFRILTLTLSPEYQVKQEEDHPRTDTALVNVDVLDTVLLSLHPEGKVKPGKDSEISERTKTALKELRPFSDLIHLEELTKADMKDLLESLPNRYSSQLGQFSTC